MITMYQFAPALDLPVSVSPYCAKLELYLRLTGRAYATEDSVPLKSPTKTVPFVRLPDGTVEGDSGALIARFEAEGPRLDDGLSDALAARGRALEADAQQILYYACLYARFVDPSGWAQQKAVVDALLPWLVRPFVSPLIRKSQVKTCAQNGFDTDADQQKAVEALGRISEGLGDAPFLLGDAPRTYDCAVWANVLQIAATRSPSPPRDAARADARLMAYVQRLADRVGFELPAFG